MKLNVTRFATATILGALFSVACSSSSSSPTGKNGDAGNGTGGSGATGSGTGGSGVGGASGASGGKGGLGSGTGGSGVGNADAGADGSAGVDGGGVKAPPGRGTISINQVSAFDNYSASAGFASFKGFLGQRQGSSKSTCTTTGACLACVIPAVVGDAGTLPTAPSGLDAGAIEIIGAGASQVTLTYGPIAQTGFSGYRGVDGQTKFFAGGDSVSVTGVGGADLPAFPAETVIAPSDIVLTAPACTSGGCADVDRTKDLALAWTGGSVGSVTATFETLSTDSVTILTCDFDAKAGKGTIPIAVLALLAKSGDPGITGIEGFSVSNKKDFLVGDIPTTFQLSISIVQGALNVSK